ncbi:MAG: hypothetical protein JW705_01155 [Methanosarcinaceae archaeon]|nr:hypothetical protein [Methanosarcinaceae archaeon]
MKSKPIPKKKDSEKKKSAVVPEEDDDADYKPMLQGVINTRCNYDGGKVDVDQD